MKRNNVKQITIRLTADEYAHVKQLSKSSGLKMEPAIRALGIFSVSTASHGGIMVYSELSPLFLPTAWNCGFSFSGWRCFEEDSDAPIVIRELLDRGILCAPHGMSRAEYEHTIDQSIQHHHPKYWNARVRHEVRVHTAIKGAEEKFR